MVWKAVARTALAATLCLGAEATCRSREERTIDAIVDGEGRQSIGPGDAALDDCFGGVGSTVEGDDTAEQREAAKMVAEAAWLPTFLGNREAPANRLAVDVSREPHREGAGSAPEYLRFLASLSKVGLEILACVPWQAWHFCPMSGVQKFGDQSADQHWW